MSAASALHTIEQSTATIARIEAVRLDAVMEAREHGVSWQMIADSLGVARQSAHARYGKLGQQRFPEAP